MWTSRSSTSGCTTIRRYIPRYIPMHIPRYIPMCIPMDIPRRSLVTRAIVSRAVVSIGWSALPHLISTSQASEHPRLGP